MTIHFKHSSTNDFVQIIDDFFDSFFEQVKIDQHTTNIQWHQKYRKNTKHTLVIEHCWWALHQLLLFIIIWNEKKHSNRIEILFMINEEYFLCDLFHFAQHRQIQSKNIRLQWKRSQRNYVLINLKSSGYTLSSVINRRKLSSPFNRINIDIIDLDHWIF